MGRLWRSTTIFALTFFFGAADVIWAMSPQEAARGVLRRLLPARAAGFIIDVIPSDNGADVFEIESRDGKIVLRGSNGLAICSALNWYLKYSCHASISWCGSQVDLPDPLPAVEGKVRKVARYRYRYFFNYCAFSYSMAWWDWTQWEDMIDWMALHGVNMPLAVTGQEATWQAVYRKLGLSDKQITDFLVGPGYLPFGWMGCIDGWGGPLFQSWIDRHKDLQTRIVARQRDLGMTPVLQGFTGHVPIALKDKFPDAKIQQPSPWCDFPATYFLDPMDPLFERVGKEFIEEQTRQFGTDHLYASDTFIEMSPPSNDPEFLAGMGKAVYGAMRVADPTAIWVMQGWVFVNNPQFWKPPQAKALFGTVPDDRLILLDMSGGDSWQTTEAFYGKPWILTFIQDFGGVVSLHGDLPRVVQQVSKASTADHRGKMMGIGMIMESLGYNPIFDDLLMELNWREEVPKLDEWTMEYVHRRYGRKQATAEAAWKLLLDSVYRSGGATMSILCARPALEGLVTHSNLNQPYNPATLAGAGRKMLECAETLGDTDTYRFDLVNITRQVLSDFSKSLHNEIIVAYKAKDREKLAEAGKRFLDLGNDLDRLLATRREFLLGVWMAEAKRWAATDQEKRLLEWNARNQITLWGSKDSMLHGYAHKQWSGMFAGFYVPRWRMFIDRLEKALATGKEMDAPAFDKEIREWEEKWTHQTDEYPSEPDGDSIEVASRLWDKWMPDRK